MGGANGIVRPTAPNLPPAPRLHGSTPHSSSAEAPLKEQGLVLAGTGREGGLATSRRSVDVMKKVAFYRKVLRVKSGYLHNQSELVPMTNLS